MQAPFGVECDGVTVCKDDATGTDTAIDHAAGDDTGPDCGCCIIATAGNDGNASRDAQQCCGSSAELAGDLRTFVEPWEPRTGDPQRGQDFGRIIACADVHQECAGTIGDICCVDITQHEADVVFGEHDVGDAGVVCGFVIAHPEDFGSLEPGQSRITRDGEESFSADFLGDFGALCCGTLIVPQQGRADDGVGVVEEDRAVHLTGQADAADVCRVDATDDGADCLLGATPPIRGVLFAPERLWGRNGVLGESAGDNGTFAITDDCFGAGRSDIEPDEERHSDGLYTDERGEACLAPRYESVG